MPRIGTTWSRTLQLDAAPDAPPAVHLLRDGVRSPLAVAVAPGEEPGQFRCRVAIPTVDVGAGELLELQAIATVGGVVRRSIFASGEVESAVYIAEDQEVGQTIDMTLGGILYCMAVVTFGDCEVDPITKRLTFFEPDSNDPALVYQLDDIVQPLKRTRIP